MSIRVKVLYFGQTRDASEKGEESFSLPDRSSISSLLDRIASEHPRFGRMRKAVQLAVNEEIVDIGWQLKDGDIVALLPPVAGG